MGRKEPKTSGDILALAGKVQHEGYLITEVAEENPEEFWKAVMEIYVGLVVEEDSSLDDVGDLERGLLGLLKASGYDDLEDEVERLFTLAWEEHMRLWETDEHETRLFDHEVNGEPWWVSQARYDVAHNKAKLELPQEVRGIATSEGAYCGYFYFRAYDKWYAIRDEEWYNRIDPELRAEGDRKKAQRLGEN